MTHELAANVRVARERKGLSLRALEAESGVSFSLIAHVERGAKSLSIENLVRLAKTLGVSTDYLLGLEGK